MPQTRSERIETYIREKSLDELKEEFNEPGIDATMVLYAAICSQWVDGTAWLLKRDDVEVNRPLGQDGNTLFHMFASTPMAKFLLNSPKLDVNAKNNNGDTALSQELRRKTEYLEMWSLPDLLCHPKLDLNPQETLRLLSICIENKKDVKCLNLLLSDPRIHRALEAVSEEQIQTLWGVANKFAKGEMKRAIVCRILMYFLQKKPELTFEDARKKFPDFLIHRDARAWFDISKNAMMLPEHLIFCFGFKLVFEPYSPQQHSLHHPVSNFYLQVEHQQAFESLLQSGQYLINQQDGQGDTALHIAARDRILSLVKCLLKQEGLDPTLPNHKGETPLHLLMLSNDKEILQLLLKHSKMTAEAIHAQDDKGNTPLRLALKKGYIATFKVLLADDRLKAENKQLRIGANTTIPDPEIDLGAFLAHPLMKESPLIAAFYAALSVLIDNPNFTSYEEVFKAFKDKGLNEHAAWSTEDQEIAFQYTLRTLDEHRADLFALTVFFCDGLLAPKQIEGLSEADVEKMLNPTRFFRIMKKLPIELQMIACNSVYGSPKQSIPDKASGPAFKRLAKRF